MEWLSPAVAVILALFGVLITIVGYLIKAHWSRWGTTEIAKDSRLNDHGKRIAHVETKTAVHEERLKQHDKDIEHLDEKIDRSQTGG